MNVLVTPLSVVGLIAILYLLLIFANLSRRLGAVTKMKPYYRGYYAALAFLSVSCVARVVLSSLALSPPSSRPILLSSPFFSLAVYHVPFVIAMAISVGITWQYWSWLLKTSYSLSSPTGRLGGRQEL